jgi:hypothetical protein
LRRGTIFAWLCLDGPYSGAIALFSTNLGLLKIPARFYRISGGPRKQSKTYGDSYLRTLLIHGARAVIRTAKCKEDRLSQWVTALLERRHPNVAAAALANKTARIAWAMLRNGTDYQPDEVSG